MEFKKSPKLPEGVGKKIVDALKKQSQAISEMQIDETPAYNEMREVNQTPVSFSFDDKEEVSCENKEISCESVGFEENDFTLESELKDGDEISFDDFKTSQQEENSDSFEYYDEPTTEEVEEIIPEQVSYTQAFNEPEYEEVISKKSLKAESSYSKSPFDSRRPERITLEAEQGQINLELSTNVEVLKRLIFQLPTGVTRQTGAQIIRQTMEAMGVSMNKVLTEAQQAQDEFQHSIRDTMNTIEEYRNNIRILEKEVQSYRKQSDELEDIISLFILSEKEDKK